MEIPRPRVVIAEDSAFARAVVVDMLSGDEFELHEARDGREALDLCRMLHPDLLILDLQMPRLGGENVLARITADPKLETLAVLVLTADEREQMIADLLDAGASDVIVKPARPIEFAARVRRALRENRPTLRVPAVNTGRS
jgi:DNA-binding response OmpR family regulator